MIIKDVDLECFKFIANCGFLNTSLVNVILNKSRLRTYIKEGYIKSEGRHLLYGSLQDIYTLSNKTKALLRKDFIMDIYKSDTNQLEHDYLLGKVYLSLPNNIKQSWINETALKRLFPSEKVTCDSIFTTLTDKIIAVEIITSSYSKETIDLKHSFITKYCDDKIMINTNGKEF